MSHSANFRPAGLEDDSDEDEFDYMGTDYNTGYYSKSSESHVHTTQADDKRGGFGKPEAVNGTSQTAVCNGVTATAESSLSPNHHKPTKGRPVHVLDLPPQNSGESSEGKPIENGHKTSSNAKRKGKAVKPNCLQSAVLPVDDFRMAVMRNNITRVEECLDIGIHVDTVFSTGWTALMYAGSYGKVDTVRLLLERGAESNYSKDCLSVLMVACSSTCSSEADVLKCVAMLLDKGADVNAYDRHHDTPLLNATKKGKVSVVKKLLEAGSNVDKQDNNGYTALMWAVRYNNLRMLQVLLEAGADYSKQTASGEKAIDMASINGFNKAEELLNAKVDPNVACDVSGILEAAPTSLMSTEDTSSSTGEDVAPSHTPTTLPSMKTLQGIGADGVYKHGELEVFLSGLDLAELIPKFAHHNIQFPDFLRMTDKDLQQLGITKMGVRKRILDAIQDTHKKDWQTSSVNVVQYNKPISCADAVAMVTNIKKHASYISSSIGYITDQVKANPDILAQAEEQYGGEELAIQSEEAITNVRFLYEELAVLRNFLTEATGKPQYKPADLIQPRCNRQKTSLWRPIRSLLVCAAFSGVVYYKRQLLTDGLSSLYSQIIAVTR